jgi:bacillithiol system protein YtxJ
MGIFSSKKSDFNWLIIKDMVNYKDAIDLSFNKPIMIFKHSTRCSISSLALNRIENVKNQETIIKSCYFLDLLSYRDISNKIATDFNVIHASPQILIIKNGKCIYNTSHSNINWGNIKI